MLDLLITLIVICLVAYLFFWLLGRIELPEPIRTVVVVLAALVFILWFVGRSGLLAGL